MRKIRLHNFSGHPFPLMDKFMTTLEKDKKPRWFKKLDNERLLEILRITSKEIHNNKIKSDDERIIKLMTDNTARLDNGQIIPLDFSFWYIETNKIYELKKDIKNKANNPCDEGYYIEE